MKKFKVFGLFAMCSVMVFLFTGCALGIGDKQDLSAMIAVNYPKVVSIHTSGGTAGSGVIIYAGNGFSLVATNAHVVANGSQIFSRVDIINWSVGLLQGKYDTSNPNALNAYTVSNIRIATNGTANTNTLLYWSEEEDLAIIKYTPPSGHGNSAAPLRTEPLRVGEPIAALGYSFGIYHRASVGVVSQVWRTRSFDTGGVVPKTFEYGFLHDAITVFGNSGGPVFDARGNVVGLTTLGEFICKPRCVPRLDCCLALGFSFALSSRHMSNVVGARAGCWGLSGSTHLPGCKLC